MKSPSPTEFEPTRFWKQSVCSTLHCGITTIALKASQDTSKRQCSKWSNRALQSVLLGTAASRQPLKYFHVMFLLDFSSVTSQAVFLFNKKSIKMFSFSPEFKKIRRRAKKNFSRVNFVQDRLRLNTLFKDRFAAGLEGKRKRRRNGKNNLSRISPAGGRYYKTNLA